MSKVATSKTKLKEQDTTRKNLPCQVGDPGEVDVTPKTSLKTGPAGLPGTMEADYPAKAPPLHLTATQVTYRCGVEPPSD